MSFRALLARVKPHENRNFAEYIKFFSSTENENKLPKKPSQKESSIILEERKKQIEYQKAFESQYIQVREQEDVHIVSGVPEEHIKTRKVCIYQPAKNAMQSGTNNIKQWQIDFDTRERWENPLMGWCSTGDPMSNMKVEFSSVDEAIAHCNKMGWEYYIQKPNPVGPKPRSYGQNFSWNKRTRVSTK